MVGIDSISHIFNLNLSFTVNFNYEFGSIAFVFTNESSITISTKNPNSTTSAPILINSNY